MKRVVETAQATKNVELESLVKLQAQKIAELEATYVNLNHEKESLTSSYQRLSEKHKTLVEKVDWEKAELAEAHAMELAGVQEELDKETQDYTDYRLNMRHRLRDLHGVVASSFGEVKARCLPFPIWNAKVEELIDWVVGEVKTMPDTVW
jgi:predicted nuclease with TOPRIM domain